MAKAEGALPQEVVMRHLSSFTDVVDEWELSRGSPYYQLDLKMLNLTVLRYAFEWKVDLKDKKSTTSLPGLDIPWSIAVLNLSMNDLMHLDPHSLHHFTNLRSLEVSLNRLDHMTGVEVCKELRRLVASHNLISKLDGLHGCSKLVYLDLSVNLLTSLSLMPNLSNLSVLNINNNKVKDLEGIQALRHLSELRAQKNFVTNTIPLAGCLDLMIMDLGNNEIRSLRITTESISGLPKLQSLTLKGNPVALEREYRAALSEAAPTLLTIDHSLAKEDFKQPLEPLNRHMATGSMCASSLSHQVALKEAARRIFLEQLADRKRLMEVNIDFLHKKIRDVQIEYGEYEEAMQKELDSCMRYLDRLGPDGLKNYDVNKLGSKAWPWGSPQGFPQARKQVHPMMDLLQRGPHVDQQDAQAPTPDTAELLRLASNRLARDQLK